MIKSTEDQEGKPREEDKLGGLGGEGSLQKQTKGCRKVRLGACTGSESQLQT